MIAIPFEIPAVYPRTFKIYNALVHCKLSLFALLRSFERARDLANSFDPSSIGGFAKSQSRSKSLSHIRTFKIYNALVGYLW